MTLMLETESHGEIESGFWGPFTQFARLGDYTFATRHLCELVEYLANNPKVRQSQILGYNLNKFWQRQEEDEQEFIEMIFQAEQPCNLESLIPHIEMQLKKQQGEVSAKDEVDLHDEGVMVPIKVTDDEKSISIGDYKVAALHFGRMAAYLANGGLMGWMDGEMPDFAKSTIQSIKSPKRELYREIKEEL